MADPAAVVLTENDTEPMEVNVRDRNGNVLLDTGASATFAMKARSDAKVVTVECEILDAEEGLVEVPWANDDLDTPGLYDSEIEVTFPNGKVRTFPSAQLIDVRAELA